MRGRPAPLVAFERPALAETARQLWSLGLGSLPIATLALAFFGVVLEKHAALQAQRALLDLDRIGPMFMKLLVREFAPIMAGSVLAARLGSATGAELAWMDASEQLDALSLYGARIGREVYLPRLLAGILGTLLVGVVGVLAASLAAGGFAQLTGTGRLSAFVSPRLVDGKDLALFWAKLGLDGASLPLAAFLAARRHGRGPRGIARAASTAVVWGVLCVLVWDILLGLAFA